MKFPKSGGEEDKQHLDTQRDMTREKHLVIHYC